MSPEESDGKASESSSAHAFGGSFRKSSLQRPDRLKASPPPEAEKREKKGRQKREERERPPLLWTVLAAAVALVVAVYLGATVRKAMRGELMKSPWLTATRYGPSVAPQDPGQSPDAATQDPGQSPDAAPQDPGQSPDAAPPG